MSEDPSIKELAGRKPEKPPASWDNPPKLPGTKNLIGLNEWQKWISDCEAQDRRLAQERWERRKKDG